MIGYAHNNHEIVALRGSLCPAGHCCDSQGKAVDGFPPPATHLVPFGTGDCKLVWKKLPALFQLDFSVSISPEESDVLLAGSHHEALGRGSSKSLYCFVGLSAAHFICTTL